MNDPTILIRNDDGELGILQIAPLLESQMAKRRVTYPRWLREQEPMMRDIVDDSLTDALNLLVKF
jgi:hypothetical protein